MNELHKPVLLKEVIEGLNVIDSIAAVETDRNDRPLNDIIMKIKIVKK